MGGALSANPGLMTLEGEVRPRPQAPGPTSLLVRVLLRGSGLAERRQQEGQQVEGRPLFLKAQHHQSPGEQRGQPGQDGGLVGHHLQDKEPPLVTC